MAITSADICAAADQLKGFVGFNVKTGQHIVRFSEDAFGLDVAENSITPTSEFVWATGETPELMTLKRDRLSLLSGLRIDERLNIGEPLRIYLRREDLPEISAQRQLQPSG
ncbi:hypothetical protein M2262_001785 [Pseudomonas sp. BIGb0408]|uniref:PA1123-like domain-containing protein n=1 Tax=Phytopseudomonas flavescens TaxID=29435 RepID=A0A7Y9XP50_9GAMM|nr:MULTISPECIES: DUF2025 family protein [Pseudomonas]MCW2291735.1 hypothetical protein [Pseudomonas sp. BIGb0408]NYH73694.1 hypothetical protein [Pseudomonas flavescens]